MMQHKLPNLEGIAAFVRECLDDEYDEQAFLDTVEGETDALEMLDMLGRQLIEAEANATGIAEAIKALNERKQRMHNRVTNCRGGINYILGALNLDKIERPLFTASRTKARDFVAIVDEAEVPSQLCRTTVTPDKVAIKKQLDAGETVPGCELQTGAPGLTVRVK